MAIDNPTPNQPNSILTAFDAMADSLREALIELENRVESRTRDLEIAGEVSRQAATVLDLDALLPHVAELTRDSFNLYHAHIYLLDETGENLVLTAGAGEIGERMVAEGRVIPFNHERSIVAQAARSGLGVIVNNVAVDPNFLPHPLLPETRAEMAIPMIFGEQVVGVLDVQASETGRFTDNDMLVKSALAAQIAVAVQNARAFAQSEAAQKELTRIFDSSIDLIGSANFAGYFTRLNAAWENTLGWSSQELMAEPFVSFVHPDDVAATNAEAAKIAQGVTTLLFENRYRCKDGSYKWISWRATPDLQNSLIHFVARDVTETKRAEEQIRLYADVVNNSPIGMYVWQLEDPDDVKSFRLLAANPASAEATGVQPDMIVGKKMIEAFAGLFDTPVPGIYFNVVKSQQAVELGEVRYGDANIAESIFYVRAFPLPNNCVGVSFENITARKQQEEALAESEARFRDIAHTMPGAIFQFTAKDGVWSVPFMSAGVEAITGVSAEAIMQDLNNFIARIHPDDLNEYVASVGAVVESMQPWDYTGRLVKPTGEIVWWHGLSQPSRNAEGDLVFNGVLFDITAQKQFEAERQILFETANALNDARTPDELLRAAEKYAQATNLLSASLLYIDSDAEGTPLWVETVAVSGQSGEIGARYYLPELPFSRLWISNPDSPIFIEDIDTSDLLDATTRAIYTQLQTRASVVIPLYTQERWVALLTFSWQEPRTFSEMDQRIYASIGQQATPAVDAVRTAQINRKRAFELEIVAHVSAAASTNLNIDNLLQDVVDLTKDGFGLYHTHVYLLDAAGENLVLAAGAGEIGRQMVAETRIIPLDREDSLVATAARTREGVIVNNVTLNPNFLPHPLLPDTRSEMAVPMVVGDTLIGVLDVQSDEIDHFTPEDVHIQNTLAAQVAVAIQNARIFAQSQASEKELNRIFDSSIDLIGSANFAGYFTRLNAAWENTLGWSSQELMAEPFVSFVHPDDVAATNAEAAKIAQGVTTLLFENRYRCKDGSYKWISWRATPDLQNSLIHFVARDVTETKRQEDLLKQSQAQLQSILDNSTAVIYVKGVDGRYILINRQYEELFHIKNADIAGKTDYDIFPKDIAEALEKVDRQVIKDGKVLELEETVPHDDGLHTYISAKFPLYDANGEIYALCGISTDITERTRQEKALAESEARFRDIAHTMPGAIFQFTAKDGVWSVPFMSAGVEAITGVSAEDIMADLNNFIKLVHPDDLDTYLSSITAVLETFDTWDYTGRLVKPTGEIVWWHGLSQPSRNEEGDLVFNGVLFDITDTKQAEAALAENQAKLSEAINVARMGYWELDVDRGVFIFNDQFYSLLHTTAEEQGGYEMPIQDYATRFLPAEYVPMVAEATKLALSATDPNFSNELEHPIIRADGTKGHFLVRVRIQKNAEGRTIKSYGTNQDISEQKQVEQERQILFETAQALNNAQTSDQLLDAASQYAANNGAISTLLLYIDSDEHGEPVWAEVVGEWQANGEHTFLGGRFYLPEFPFAKLWMSDPDNPILIEDINTSDLMDDATRAIFQQAGNRGSVIIPLHVQNRWVGLLTYSWQEPQRFTEQDERIYTAIAQQATPAVDAVRVSQINRKRALELETVAYVSAEASSNLRIDSLLQDVTDLTKESFKFYHVHIYLLDETGENLVLASGAGEAGRAMVAQGHKIPFNREDSLVATAARTRQGVIVNDVTQNPNFLPNPLLPDTKAEMAIPMIVGDELIGVIDTQADVTNRFTEEDVRIKTTLAAQVAVAIQNARAFEKSREADRLKSEFLANMSHELRTPLNSIIGYAEVLLDGIDGELTEDMNEDVRAIHGSGQHLLNIINDILDLAKIEAGKMSIDRQPVDLTRFAREIVRAGQILVKNKPVELHLIEDESLPKVRADSVRLRQIIWNLLSNAVKFTEAGAVTVTTGMHDDDHVYVEVRDTGIGIRKEDLPRIFEQFRQVDGSSTRRAGGTGLGLNITRHLINMHEGEIFVDSDFGQGSVFRFTLPIVTEERVTN